MTYKNIVELIELNEVKDTDIERCEYMVVYSIVRESLGMSSGKIAGQCQHAMQYLMQHYNDVRYDVESKLASVFRNRYEDWIHSKTHTKVILTASDKEWEKLREEYDPLIVKDAGKTEIAAGSETVMILFPMFKDERNKTLKRCQLLK